MEFSLEEWSSLPPGLSSKVLFLRFRRLILVRQLWSLQSAFPQGPSLVWSGRDHVVVRFLLELPTVQLFPRRRCHSSHISFLERPDGAGETADGGRRGCGYSHVLPLATCLLPRWLCLDQSMEVTDEAGAKSSRDSETS